MKIACTDEKPIKIDYNISGEILMINLKYNLFNWYSKLVAFCKYIGHGTLLMGIPMISLKVIVECPDLSTKKQFKKVNPLKRGWSTQYWRGGQGSLFKIGG